MDFLELRKQMVQEQIAGRGISVAPVLEAFLKVERHRFVPLELAQSAYADFPLAIGEGQTISQPYIVALMSKLLGLSGKEKVLEVGTGSGYQTAILAELAQEVCTIERFKDLSESAKSTLSQLGYSNIKFKVGDGTLGWPEEEPFDRIIVTATSPRIPLPLEAQLKEGGIIVMPLGGSFSQVLTLARKENWLLHYQEVCGCVFVPLIGKFGLKEGL